MSTVFTRNLIASYLLMAIIFTMTMKSAAASNTIIWHGTPESMTYNGQCQQTCCCPVCGSPTNDAFPYGLTVVSITSNPPFPQVRGSSCHFSIWSDNPYNDTNGHPATVPDTVFWSNYSVFVDYQRHIAPISCDCCKFSGVDTSCKETIPAATYPKYFFIVGGLAQEYQGALLQFMDGVQLNASDYVELRNDTHCGYMHPKPVLRLTNLTITNQTFTSQINVARLPSRGCYKVCYYASALTTPQWYDLGYLTVNAKPQPALTFVLGSNDIPFAGAQVTITYFGKRLLSVFSDVAELRSSGVCGAASPALSTASGTAGILDTVGDDEWCKPAVLPKITAQRPLNYIAIQYSDCGPSHRVYQSRTRWVVTFPTSGITLPYTVCYFNNGTWFNTGTVTIPGQQTAATALRQLYTATNGLYWKRNTNWAAGVNPCTFFGVRCDAFGNVVSIYLGRNNLTGTIPKLMFYAPYFATMSHIALDMNTLSGTVPREIGTLKNLKFLDIGFNQLSGTLPSTLADTSLYITYLGNNDLSGHIPASIDSIGLSWSSYGNSLTAPAVPPVAPGCPVDVMECSQRGSTDYGTTQCGPDGLGEAACLVYGCCFNAQAPLIFGGSACFTHRRVTYLTYPPCQQLTCMPNNN